MGTVIIHKSLSLDGFAAGPNVSIDRPMGDGGQILHRWMFGAAEGSDEAKIVRELHASTGAVVIGRRTLDVGFGIWNDTPFAAPSFVVTHRVQEPISMPSGRFSFVDSLPEAIAQAKAASGDRSVCLMGVDISRKALFAGLVDELHLQIVPILLGDGQRLFVPFDGQPIELDVITVVESPAVTHIRYRIAQPQEGNTD
jgi:dihydrofolate reductase